DGHVTGVQTCALPIYGDAMWALLWDGRELGGTNSAYSVNDIFKGAELAAPMSVHGTAIPRKDETSIALAITAEPWPYTVGRNKRSEERRVGKGCGERR